MLQMSEKAAVALETLRRSQEIPDSHDTRLSAARDPGGDLAIRLEFVEEAKDDDQVAEQAGTELFVDSGLAESLSNAVMDVEETEEGVMTFVFRTPSPEG